MLHKFGAKFEFCQLIGIHLKPRGRKSWQQCTLASQLKEFYIIDKNIIGWDTFVQGTISQQFRDIVWVQLLLSHIVVTADEWKKKLISSLMNLVHTQWLYHIAMLHERVEEDKTRLDQERLLERIETH